MNDQEWANESLRKALQNIEDAATKPLHVEIDRLRRELAEARGLLQWVAKPSGFGTMDGGMFVSAEDVAAIRAFLAEKP